MRSVTKEQLIDILNKHSIWLENRFKGVRADLDYVNLKGFDLEGFNLKGASLIGSNLEDTNLMYTNLMYADLMLTKLKGAKFHCTNVSGADFTDSTGADLFGGLI